MSKELKIYGSISITPKRIKVDINDLLFAIPFPKIINGNDEDVIIRSRAPVSTLPVRTQTDHSRFDVHFEYRVIQNRYRPWTRRTVKVARVCLPGDKIDRYQLWEEEVHPTTGHNAAAHTAAVHYTNDFGRRTGTII